jgi:hypothetical protein
MKRSAAVLAATAAVAVAFPGHSPARAHCDGMDGPVVASAREALQAGDPARVLHWVGPEGEKEVRAAFARAMKVRALGPEVRELADLHLFETVVRVHRAGEGAPYTGLKPAGRDLGPAIPAADRALADGDVEPLVKLLLREVEDGVRARFRRARSTRGFAAGDLAAGREHVAAYVDYVHFVEGLHALASRGAAAHGDDHQDEEEPAGHGHGHR